MKPNLSLAFSGLVFVGILFPVNAQLRTEKKLPPNPFEAFTKTKELKTTPTIESLEAPQPLRFGAGKKAGEIKINPKDGAQMVWVPAGAFLIGSTIADKQAKGNEMPQHKIMLSGYWIYRTEVTVEQYKKFVAATNGKMPLEPTAKWQDYHPIANVDWNAAKAYCEWAGVRLPTEAEWEKAARGADGRLFPNGKTFNQNYGWSKEASGGFDAKIGTALVGSFPAGISPYGCLDMAGNVWEWCQDYYGEKYYEISPAINPTGPKFSGSRVFRGGSWLDALNNVRCASRGNNVPTLANDSLGFRCASNP